MWRIKCENWISSTKNVFTYFFLVQCFFSKILSCKCCCCRRPLQLVLGHGARRLHVSAAYRAKANVSMSRFEPSSFVNYERMQANVDIVRKRSVPLSSLRVTTVFPQARSYHPRISFTFHLLNLLSQRTKETFSRTLKLLFFRAAPGRCGLRK